MAILDIYTPKHVKKIYCDFLFTVYNVEGEHQFYSDASSHTFPMLCHSAIKNRAQFLIPKLRYRTSYPEPVHKIVEQYW